MIEIKIKYDRKRRLFIPWYREKRFGRYHPLLTNGCYIFGEDSYSKALLKSIKNLKERGMICKNFDTDNLDCLNCQLKDKTIDVL